jgi:hypothetical protein
MVSIQEMVSIPQQVCYLRQVELAELEKVEPGIAGLVR